MSKQILQIIPAIPGLVKLFIDPDGTPTYCPVVMFALIEEEYGAKNGTIKKIQHIEEISVFDGSLDIPTMEHVNNDGYMGIYRKSDKATMQRMIDGIKNDKGDEQ